MIKEALRKTISPIKTCQDTLRLYQGLRRFDKTMQTPPPAYQAMIQLHGKTNGRSTRYLAEHFSKKNPPSLTYPNHSILGTFSDNDIEGMVQSIRENGFYRFEQRLPETICDQIEEAVKDQKANTWRNGELIQRRFSPGPSNVQVFKYPESYLLQVPCIQSIMADATFQRISARYIEANPILCSVNTWYSTHTQEKDEDHGGQKFHFDMSRVKWLNFFMYLSDVDASKGPHTYVKQSHLFKNQKAKKLLKRGYVRIPDNDIIDAYGQENIIELTGKRGTIFAVDTIGFHRGKPVEDGHRLMFEIIYASSLFGGRYQTQALPNTLVPELESAIATNPSIYQRLIKQ